MLLALSSQVLGWLLISWSLPRLPAATTSVLLTVQPLGSVLLAALIFSESPSMPQLAGVALVLCALVVAGRACRARSPRARIACRARSGLNRRALGGRVDQQALERGPLGLAQRP